MHPLLFHFGSVLIPTYGVFAALAVLAALSLSTWLSSFFHVEGNKVWNFGLIVIFSAIVASRLILAIWNFQDLRTYPLWLLGLALIPDSLTAGLAILCGALVGFLYARKARIPSFALLDCLAPAIALGHAIELIGCFAAGCAYGSPTSAPWAVVYHSHLAAAWSGTPISHPLHPVQLYEAAFELLFVIGLIALIPRRRQAGDLIGIWCFAEGLAHFLWEFFRGDPGRGELLGGFLTGTQLFSVGMVVVAGFLLRKRDTLEQKLAEEAPL